jgi:intracellular sulfur oxidation DsrE/DsrF family protein
VSARYRAVIHVDEDSREKLMAALRNAYNLLDSVGEKNAEVAFVFNVRGPLTILRGSLDDYTREQINELLSMGVKFFVCSISLRALGVKKEDLIDGVEVVDSGIKRIVELEREGYAYIKP